YVQRAVRAHAAPYAPADYRSCGDSPHELRSPPKLVSGPLAHGARPAARAMHKIPTAILPALGTSAPPDTWPSPSRQSRISLTLLGEEGRRFFWNFALHLQPPILPTQLHQFCAFAAGQRPLGTAPSFHLSLSAPTSQRRLPNAQFQRPSVPRFCRCFGSTALSRPYTRPRTSAASASAPSPSSTPIARTLALFGVSIKPGQVHEQATQHEQRGDRGVVAIRAEQPP